MRGSALGPPKVFDVVVPLEQTTSHSSTVHVGVRTTFLRAFYAPLAQGSAHADGLCRWESRLLVAFLLSNLALRPMEQISLQLDYWTTAGENAEEDKAERRQDMAARVSTKIEQIGQRMRNVEEVFSALKDNLDQILGNLQDGILLFTGDGRAVLVSEAARRFLQVNGTRFWDCMRRRFLTAPRCSGQAMREAFEPASLGQGRDPHRDRAADSGVNGFYP